MTVQPLRNLTHTPPGVGLGIWQARKRHVPKGQAGPRVEVDARLRERLERLKQEEQHAV